MSKQSEYIKKRYGNNDGIYPKCSVSSCNHGVYAHGLCRKHYDLSKRNGKPVYKSHECAYPGCKKGTFFEYCWPHKKKINSRLKNGLHLMATSSDLKIGALNNRWNGDASYYKNHAEMKRIRNKIIKEREGKCEICGGVGNEIHHKDMGRINHDKENLILCCRKCHKGTFHSLPRKNTKYIRLYGMSLREMGEKLGYSVATIGNYHKNGKLKYILK
jgi:hypothetical protein